MPDQVVLRSTGTGLLVVLDDGGNFADIKQRLLERLETCGAIFEEAEVTVDLGRRDLEAQELLELKSLISECRGMRLVRVIHGDGQAGEDARGATVLRSGPLHTFTGKIQDDPLRRKEDVPTLLVRGTVRSGQEIRYEGHVVVFGDVNPGGEVVASGDIIVLGSLRGVAHAGASGDEAAVVAAMSLRPIQLRIATVVGRQPEGEEAPGGPEVARVRDGCIVVEGYSRITRGGMVNGGDGSNYLR